MTNFQKAVQAMHHAAEQYGVSVVALVLEDEKEAIVASSTAKSLLFAQELIEVSVDNIPEEMLEEECECSNCKPKENKFFQLMHESFPGLLDTMPDDVRQRFVERFEDKSNETQERFFEKSFSMLQMFNTILNK